MSDSDYTTLSPNISAKKKIILGIETSCDETAAAVIDSERRVLSNIIHSQIADHALYGGVVPEIAARQHTAKLPQVLSACLGDSGLSGWGDIDAIAVTAGPGLVGGLITGMMVAKGMASALDIPCIAVNHLVGHALTPRLTHDVNFPYLLLLTSGGHCIIAVVHSALRYDVLGQTLDDAAGEAFDKVAKILGLGYPGGPNIERWAVEGSSSAFKFPEPFADSLHCNFSFSGLKTAVNRIVDKQRGDRGELSPNFIADVCASFQDTVAKIMVNRLQKAIKFMESNGIEVSSLVIAGGVAANQCIRDKLQALANRCGLPFYVPAAKFCTDNAAMIAWAGMEMISMGAVDVDGSFFTGRLSVSSVHDYDFPPRPRWPLENFI